MRKNTSTNFINEEFLNGLCPLQQSIHLITGRWTTAILFGISNGKNRFGTLKSEFPIISKKMLAERVKHLETFELITKNILSEKPLNVEYQLTEKGKELLEVLFPLNDWGEKWLNNNSYKKCAY
ncbi:MAG: winged helix-turn-helix transcriptional regulator [Lactococcus garvieae]